MRYEIYKQAQKIYGYNNQIVIADGTIIKGKYVLLGSGMVLSSHDPLHGFQKSFCFPLDENGNTSNDRDYQHDKDAQRITLQIAKNYDSRAIQSPIIVSTDGIVFSGNGRTMAGRLAAVNGTDQEYIKYLVEYGEQYGFNKEVLSKFHHPRIVFEVDSSIILPYTPSTFARFNSQEMKTQSKTEKAIKLGKVIDDHIFSGILSIINRYDTLGDFYSDKEASTKVLQELQKAGVFSVMEWPSLLDDGVISDDGKNLLESVLVGKSFSSDPDAVRKINTHKQIRKVVIIALKAITKNATLKEFSLCKELTKAVNLTVDALNAGYKLGDTVSAFARQTDLFTGTTVGDFRNELVNILANALNSKQVTTLKRIYQTYNQEASQSASGQTDMFSKGLVRSRDEILRDCAKMFRIKGAMEQKHDDARNGTKQLESIHDIMKYLSGFGGNVSIDLEIKEKVA